MRDTILISKNERGKNKHFPHNFSRTEDCDLCLASQSDDTLMASK